MLYYLRLLIIEFSLDHKNYFERFFDDYFYIKIFALGRRVSFSFFFMRMRNWHLNTGLQLLLKISPLSVSDPVESCVCLLSRLVPVLNDTHGLA